MKRLGKLVAALPRYSETGDTSNDVQISGTVKKSTVVDCYFWIDTLCVPTKNQALREKAIQQMRDVYKSAANVLVLNTELMRSSCNRPYTEIFTRITCSSWLRRLWTLQEGLLNHNLLFQFSERAVYVGYSSRLFQKQKRDNKEKPWDLVAWECSRYNFYLLDSLPNFSQALRIGLIWNALAHRSTSRVGDEPLCIALLLGLDIEKLQKPPDAGTVKKFWSLHDENGVPACVLFLPGKKLSDEGYGWAPANLMQLRGMGRDLNSLAIVKPQGLCVSYPGFVLSQLDYCPATVIPCIVDGTKFYLRQFLREGSPNWDGLELHKRRNLAVLILVMEGSREKNAGEIEAGMGALVECQEESHDRVRYVKYLRVVSVLREGSSFVKHPNTPWTEIELKEKKQEPVAGIFLPYEQKWCVG